MHSVRTFAVLAGLSLACGSPPPPDGPPPPVPTSVDSGAPLPTTTPDTPDAAAPAGYALSAQTLSGFGLKGGPIQCTMAKQPGSLDEAKGILSDLWRGLGSRHERLLACSGATDGPLEFRSEAGRIVSAGLVSGEYRCVNNALAGADVGHTGTCKVHNLSAHQSESSDSGPRKPNLTVASTTVDGVSLRDLACHTRGGGGLLGALTIPAGLSKIKPALRQCGLTGPTEIGWTAQGGVVTKATAKGPKAACVERALKSAPMTVDGDCTAVLVSVK